MTKGIVVEETTNLGKDALENPGKYNGFMGISIRHNFFQKDNMRHYIDWFSEMFDKFRILLMDHPDTYNFRVFKFMDKEEASDRIDKISKDLKNAYERLCRKKKVENVEVIRFEDFQEGERYTEILNGIKKFKDENQEFKEDLFNLMEIGIGDKIREYFQEESKQEKIKKKLINYSIEELASIIYLTEAGYPIEIDPTIEFTTKKKLYEGDFPELHNRLNLTERGHIYAHPEGIKKSTY